MINTRLKSLIEKNALAFATVDGKGNPNVIGVAFVKVVSKNQILISNNYMKQTIDNIKKNNNVCLAVWDKNWHGYKLIGKTKYFTSGKWKKFVEDMPENKGYPAKGAIVVTIKKIKKLA
jgi:predicted pyridoxine 5'-phosphate oxidase superfamily flavin-nucleotide-binding protein